MYIYMYICMYTFVYISRYRLLGTVVFCVQHAGIVISKVTKAMKPGLSFNSEWVTTQQLKEQKDAIQVCTCGKRD